MRASPAPELRVPDTQTHHFAMAARLLDKHVASRPPSCSFPVSFAPEMRSHAVYTTRVTLLRVAVALRVRDYRYCGWLEVVVFTARESPMCLPLLVLTRPNTALSCTDLLAHTQRDRAPSSVREITPFLLCEPDEVSDFSAPVSTKRSSSLRCPLCPLDRSRELRKRK